MDLKALLPFIVYSGCFVLFMTGFILPYWIHYVIVTEYDEGSFYSGLWLRCTSMSLSTECRSQVSNSNPDWFKAVQALEIIALIVSASGVTTGFLVSCVKNDNPNIRKVSAIAGFVAAVFIVLAVIIYGAKVRDNLHAGFILTIISASGFVFSGFLLLLIQKERDERGKATYNGIATRGVIITPGNIHSAR